jgi:hypothetical protein
VTFISFVSIFVLFSKIFIQKSVLLFISFAPYISALSAQFTQPFAISFEIWDKSKTIILFFEANL